MNNVKRKKTQAAQPWFRRPIFKIVLSLILFLFIGTSAVVLHYHRYYSDIIDRRLAGEIFQRTARVYAAPFLVYTGQRITPDTIVTRLQRAGLEPFGSTNEGEGIYELEEDRVVVRQTAGQPLGLDFRNGILTRITRGTVAVEEAFLPAEMVTSLFDESRQRRRVVEFSDLPPVLVNALLSAEDHRFFRHWGIDPIRVGGAILASIRNSARVGGVSTLTQQLARNFFLTTERSMQRKIHEAFIALLLEQRLTKEQILTMYANDVYLGHRGSFSIHGFGEGANAFFGKELQALTLPEAATLAGIIPSPNPYSPERNPERAKERRNLVLTRMAALGYITEEESALAKESEVAAAPLRVDASDAPYLVDFIREELLKDFDEGALINEGLHVYTTLDPDLQRIAVDAVSNGLRAVEELVAGRNRSGRVQAALIALDARTGAIRAMAGGSDYGMSQYNRVTQAFRQPGSIFKPFVYAAAFEASLDPIDAFDPFDQASLPQTSFPAQTTPAEVLARPDEGESPLGALPTPGPQLGRVTPITTVIDEETIFVYEGDRTYEPNNYGQTFQRRPVTVRESLVRSLNVPAVKIAEHIGYQRVADLAIRAGMNANVKGYPSVALGAFEVTPLEMAGAYTVFANEGRRMPPHALLRVTSSDGEPVRNYRYPGTEVLSPEIAYMMTHLMQSVIQEGTGAQVRARGFTLPAAGKTGTSRDGWFAGYTKDYVVIAWVGYDDNTDLNLTGSQSALPIWTNFMIDAYRLYPPRDREAMEFTAPEGVEIIRIDTETMLPATPNCVSTYEAVFLPGTIPATTCYLHSPSGPGFLQETGNSIGRSLAGFGRFLGGLLGGNDNAIPEPPAPAPIP